MKPLIDWLERRFNLTEMFSFLTNFGLFPTAVDTSRPLGEALSDALGRPLPSYARWPRVLGILSVVLFLFLAVTGVMLAFYYRPTPDSAYESVTTIVRDVSFGWFVHQVHGWAAIALVLILLVRLWRFFFQGVYKTPREALWIVGVLLFLVAIHADLTGRLLAWDNGGYWSTVRALEVLYSAPVIGPSLEFVVGGSEIDGNVLIRFYFLHVVVLPGVLLALLFLNFSGVRRVGLSPLPGDAADAGGGAAKFRVHLYNLLILLVVMFGVLITLAVLAPAPFEHEADPFSTPPEARPPWYLLASHGMLEAFPAIVPRWGRALLLEAVLAAILLLPFIDRSRGRKMPERRGVIAIGLVVLVLWLYFTWYGYRLEVAS